MASYYISTTTNDNDRWINTRDRHILQKEITTIFRDEKENYFRIVLGAGYICDGLSIPAIFRWYLKSWDKENHLYNLAGAIHDALYTKKGGNIFDRENCDDIFRSLLRDAGISRTKAGMADWCVGIFAGGKKHWGNDDFDNFDRISIERIV